MVVRKWREPCVLSREWGCIMQVVERKSKIKNIVENAGFHAVLTPVTLDGPDYAADI